MDFRVTGYTRIAGAGKPSSSDKTSKNDLQRTFKISNGKLFLRAADDKFSLECPLDSDAKRTYPDVFKFPLEQSCRLLREGNIYTINTTVTMLSSEAEPTKWKTVEGVFASFSASQRECTIIDFQFDRQDDQTYKGKGQYDSHFTAHGIVNANQNCQIIDATD
jgi:hypothetical protein